MAKTYEELLEQAAIIRDETAAGKNTATRVGGTITDAVDYVKELQDTYAGIHAEASEAKTTANAAKQTAEEAKTNAGSARSIAQSAVLNAAAASGTANEAKATADAASTAAQEAKDTADSAKQTADAASNTANAAKTESAQAVSTAQAAQNKNAEQDNRLKHAEEQNTKQNERLLNYVYPKLYQLNEGAGALPFDGMYSGSASVLSGRKTAAEDGFTYKVVFASGKFLLLEINQDGEDAGLYEAWDKIISARGSSEDYTRRDCLYYIYVSGEGSTYYYIDGNGVATEQSATYLLRRLVDKNAAAIDTASSTANAAKTESAQAVSTAQAAKTTADGIAATAQAAKDTADAANTAAQEAKATADGIAATAQAAKDTADAAKAEIVENIGNLNEEDNRLNGLIAANTAKIASVESTATQARDVASSANEAAAAAQTKNTEQDARLDNIEARIDPDIAGRVWNEDNGTPKAESYYGSVKALRDLHKRLGLGRYLVSDERQKTKLHPNDSHKYLDGTPAALDGTEGQCMWCWEGFYANIWHEGSRLIKAVTFDGPVGNDISIWIPAGGISWLGAGVIDRGEAPYTDKTKWTLCSVINNSEQFRGGGGTPLDASKYTKAPADTTPQITMLGMPATNISTTDFGTYARKRGDGNGWEANWFVARFVVEFLFEIIMGTENSQEAFNANKDADGLYQGGFGTGVTDMPDWGNYNGSYPVIPTSVGLEAGDGVCLVPYSLPNTGGADGTYHTFNVPVFFGLVGAGFGNLLQFVNGLLLDIGEEQSLVYVSPSMYAAYDPNIVSDKILVAECPRVYGYIKRKSYKCLCCMPTELGGSNTLRYSDYFYTNAETSKGLKVRAAGGYVSSVTLAGASCTNVERAVSHTYSGCSAPLCYFTEDPIIPASQRIANNS